MVLTDSCFAVSMNEQVFTTITSASSALGVILAPPVSSRPIITSLSTRFLGQPRLTKPTFSEAFVSADFSCGGVTVGVSGGMQPPYSSIGDAQRFLGRGESSCTPSRYSQQRRGAPFVPLCGIR